jgi:hypothetical protein
MMHGHMTVKSIIHVHMRETKDCRRRIEVLCRPEHSAVLRAKTLTRLDVSLHVTFQTCLVLDTFRLFFFIFVEYFSVGRPLIIFTLGNPLRFAAVLPLGRQ